MLWEWWSTLSESQQAGILQAVPILLFLTNLTVKNGFNLSIDTAGADLCLVAVGLDISQTFIAMSGATPATELSTLLLTLALVHVFLWMASLRLVSFREDLFLRAVRLGTSYFLGLLAIYTSLGTILQSLIPVGVVSGY